MEDNEGKNDLDLAAKVLIGGFVTVLHGHINGGILQQLHVTYFWNNLE